MINEQSSTSNTFGSHKIYESADALVEVVEYTAITPTPPASYIQIQSTPGAHSVHYRALMAKMFLVLTMFLISLIILSGMHVIR